MIFNRFTNIKEISDDIYFLTHGYDMNAIENERKKIREEKKKQENEKKELLSVKWKASIIILCVFMLLLNIAGVVINILNRNIGATIFLFLNIILNIVTLICAAIKNKKTEIVSIIGILIIVFITLFIL